MGPNDATRHLGHGMFYFIIILSFYWHIFYLYSDFIFVSTHESTTPAIYHHHDARPLHPQRVANDSLVGFHPRCSGRTPFTTPNESQTTRWWVPTCAAHLLPPPVSPKPPAVYHPQRVANDSLVGFHPCPTPFTTPNESQTTRWWRCRPLTTTNESLRLVGGPFKAWMAQTTRVWAYGRVLYIEI
jgi:hypothetical protein